MIILIPMISYSSEWIEKKIVRLVERLLGYASHKFTRANTYARTLCCIFIIHNDTIEILNNEVYKLII